jgi:hypothetical protein
MQRVRRFAPLAVLALLAGLALAGCRSNPDTAAYVGDAKLTNKQVEALYGEVRSQDIQLDRSGLVQLWVLNQLARRIAADRDVTIPEAQVAQAAAQLKLKPDSAFARLYAEEQIAVQSVSGTATPIPATEADLRGVYQRGRAAGVIPADVTFEDARPLLDVDQLREGLGLQKMFAEASTKYDVSVNPQYGPVEYSLLPFQTQEGGQVPALVVPLDAGAASGAVVDRT